MPTMTASQLNTALKVFSFDTGVVQTYAVNKWFLSNVKPKLMDFKLGGREAEFLMRRHGGPGGRAQTETESTAEPNIPGYLRGTITTKILTASTAKTIIADFVSADQQRSYVQNTMELMERLMEEFGILDNNMAWGLGDGCLAKIQGVSGATWTLYLDQESGEGSKRGTTFLREGMIVCVDSSLSGTTHTLTGTYRIDTITPEDRAAGTRGTCTVTLLSGSDDATTDSFVFWGSRAGTSKNRAKTGVRAYVDNGSAVGTILGHSRTTYPMLKARVRSSVGTTDLEHVYRSELNRLIGIVGRENLPNVIIASLGVQGANFNQLRGERQFVNTTSFDQGFTALPFHFGSTTLPQYYEPEVPAKSSYLLNWKHWGAGNLIPTQWLGPIAGGGIWERVGRTLAYEATAINAGEYVCELPRAQVVCEGITEVN